MYILNLTNYLNKYIRINDGIRSITNIDSMPKFLRCKTILLKKISGVLVFHPLSVWIPLESVTNT